MSRYLLSLKGKYPLSRVGSKAARLAEMYSMGFPVPESFFLSTVAFKEICHTEKIYPDLNNITDSELEAFSRKIRTQIRNAHFSTALSAEVKKACNLLSGAAGQKLAVRSSAVAEDLGSHSFAGQYKTVLNVDPDFSSVEKAVKEVWASQWDLSVINYTKRNSLPIKNDGMAVILQRMVYPDVAGVLFTKNPLKNKNETLIEYVKGLAEDLVSGKEIPVQLVYDRDNDEFRDEHLIDDKYDQPLRKLVKDALKLEKNVSRPLDIEWAISNGEIYFLQYRPVTTKAAGTDHEILWTNENVGEVIPDVVTPYTWSILEPVTNKGFAWFLSKTLHVKYPGEGLFGLYKGKVYFNNSEFNETLSRFYLCENLKKLRQKKSLFFKIFSEILPAIYSLFISSFKTIIFSCILPGKIRKHLRRQVKMLTEVIFSDTDGHKDSYKKSLDILALHSKTMALHISCTIFGEVYYQLLHKLSSHFFGNHPDVNADDWLTAHGTAASSKSGIALWNLARRIQELPQINRLIMETDVLNLEKELKHSAAGAGIWREFEIFINEYGHGALHEFELFYPRWREDPVYILNNLKSYLINMDNFDLAEKLNRACKNREHKQQQAFEILNGLKNIHKRFVLQHILKRSEFYSAERENLKQLFIRFHSELKKHLFQIGKYLKEENLIAKTEDVLFLTRPEIDILIGMENRRQISKALIKERRQERADFERFDHPSHIKQIGYDWLPLDSNKDEKAPHLSGIGCSGGVTEGAVRIILDPETFHTMNKGDILITRSTNPGWTPLFVLAAAVVTEIGGALSHGAIIAREYGIPMVTAVYNITKQLKNGQRVRVNGYSGRIELI